MKNDTLSIVPISAGCSLIASAGVRRGTRGGRRVLVALVEHGLQLVHLVLNLSEVSLTVAAMVQNVFCYLGVAVVVKHDQLRTSWVRVCEAPCRGLNSRGVHWRHFVH